MTKDFQKYRDAFSRLRTDHNRKYWAAQTCFGAPHKPFLLLSVIDLAAQGQITENLIAPSRELVETFNGYWRLVMPAKERHGDGERKMADIGSFKQRRGSCLIPTQQDLNPTRSSGVS